MYVALLSFCETHSVVSTVEVKVSNHIINYLVGTVLFLCIFCCMDLCEWNLGERVDRGL